jgi:3-hydroxyacyl-CoA dehydrogenase
VVLFSRNPFLAKESLDKFLTERYQKTNPEMSSDLVTITSEIELLSETQIVIECIRENLNLKRSFLENLVEMNKSVIIGSCTSSLTLNELTYGMQDEGRIHIIHFSNPVAKMKAIELVISDKASEETVKCIQKFLSQLEHRVIEVPDVPGFVINSIIFAMLEQANSLVKEQGISKENVDELMKIGCGLPMGPFEIEKLIGKETVKLIRQNLNERVIKKSIN